MVDKALLAAKIASVADAVSRIRSVLPAGSDAFTADRTIREIVVLNLFVAIQDCVALAAHCVADEGGTVPQTYGEVFRTLAGDGVIAPDLAARLAAASGFRNLVAHQYGVLDWARVHAIAAEHLDDVTAFCEALARLANRAS
jgi:uncharacterized protein YutE (UPF0331/DUF86 family)